MNKTSSILVVDDDPAILQTYSELLRAEGYEVWEASTGQQGLQVTRERRPDLVLLDVVLPDLSGLEVCRQIKADAALTDVFVVLFSGAATGISNKLDGLETGADDYLVKQLDVPEFLARIRTLMRLRNTNAEVRASEQRHRRLVEMLPEAVVLIDLQGRILAVNPPGAEMFGYANPGELLERSIFDLTRPEDHQRLRANITKTPATGALQNVEYLLRRKSGDLFPAELSAAVAVEADGQPNGIVLVAREITERKRAEEQIRLLADVVQNTQEFICITDEQNRFTFANSAFLQAYGYTAEEIMGRTPEFLYSNKNPSGLCDFVFQQTLRGGWKGQLVNRRKDGTEFFISLATCPIKISEGRTLGLVGVARDVSQRVGAEKQSTAFAQLGYRLSAASTREQAAEIILDIGSELFGWDAGYVALYSPEHNQMAPILTVDIVEGERVRFPSTNWPRNPTPMMRRVIEEGAQLLNPTNEALQALNLVSLSKVDRHSASLMFVPIHSKGAIIGILSVQSYTPRAYSKEDLNLLQTLADHCGAALHRIEMSDSLRQAEAKYRSIVENATEGIYQTTPEGRHLSANPALALMLGYATTEDLLASVTDIERQVYVVPERRREFRQMIESQGAVRGFEAELHRKDGSKIWANVNCHVVRDASGAVLYYEGTIHDITERKRMQEALAGSERLQKAILDNIPDPAWLKDLDGRFLACNQRLAELFGRPSDQIMGETVLNLTPREAARLTQEDNEAIRARRPRVYEAPFADAQGHVKWFETVTSPLFNEAGAASGTVGISREISERKWVEDLLRRQRDYGTFLSSADDVAAAAGRLLKITLEHEGLDCGAVYLVNSENNALELTAHQGLAADFAKSASRFAADPGQHSLAGAWQTAAREQTGPMAGVLEQLKREGLLALEVIPIQHGGEVVAVLSVGSRALAAIPLKTRQAIEALATQAGGALARIQAERSLRTSQQLLEKTIQSLRSAVFIVDARGPTIRDCNPAATRVFGHSRQEIIGQSPALLHLDDARRKEFKQHLEAAVKEKGLLTEFEFKLKRKDGTSFPAEVTVEPVRNEEGQIAAWVGVVQDITERKTTEEGLRQLSQRIIEAQEAERQRVARELHDGVNQVIASVKMRLRKVEAMVAPNPAAREILARCDELLAKTLEENRRIAHDLRPADLDALGFADACRNFCRQFQARTNLVVKTRIPRCAQRCSTNTELNLFRIVQEALNNVEKHARAQSVRLRVAFAADSILLRIQDDGRGFATGASWVPKRKGKGIGLKNMRQRAALLGGTCEVESAPDQGTTITVLVPCGAGK
jgi:PAS domain S-box-containing protein